MKIGPRVEDDALVVSPRAVWIFNIDSVLIDFNLKLGLHQRDCELVIKVYGGN